MGATTFKWTSLDPCIPLDCAQIYNACVRVLITTHSYLSNVKLIIVVGTKKVTIALLSHGSSPVPTIDSMTGVQITFLEPLGFLMKVKYEGK